MFEFLITARFRCLETTILIPREKPFTCHYPNKHNDSFVTECCKQYDFCNKDLKPKLHIKPPGRLGYFLTIAWTFSTRI